MPVHDDVATLRREARGDGVSSTPRRVRAAGLDAARQGSTRTAMLAAAF